MLARTIYLARSRRGRRSAIQTFPGRSTWSGTFSGRAEHERWLKRFVAAGLKAFPDQVIAKGPPWNMTVCIRAHDHARSPDGEIVYENRFVIWGRMSWGRLKEYEAYLDTQKVEEFDAYIAQHELELAAGVTEP